MSLCRSCDAEILWATTAAGKAMPLDAVPNPNGNVEAVCDAHGRWSVVAVYKGPDLFGAVRYMPHHATCPNADEHRTRR